MILHCDRNPRAQHDLDYARHCRVTDYEVFEMSLKSLADEAVTQILKAVANPLSKEEADAVSKIVQHSLIKAVNRATEKCTDAAVVCCGPEADLAHKIAEEADRAQIALIANLTSMR